MFDAALAIRAEALFNPLTAMLRMLDISKYREFAGFPGCLTTIIKQSD
jgi:hypothetical protein